VIEARIVQLAGALGLAPPALLLGVAAHWTNRDPDSFDHGVLFWANSTDEKPSAQIAALDLAACEKLCAEIERLLQDRAAFAPSLAPVREAGSNPFSAIAIHLLRLWAHWLPGFALASPEFLLNRLIRRRGRFRIASDEVQVRLLSGPLDVILEMAGYLKPIAAVPWLGDRRITFTIESSTP
jgi:hypothetical protein